MLRPTMLEHDYDSTRRREQNEVKAARTIKRFQAPAKCRCMLLRKN